MHLRFWSRIWWLCNVTFHFGQDHWCCTRMSKSSKIFWITLMTNHLHLVYGSKFPIISINSSWVQQLVLLFVTTSKTALELSYGTQTSLRCTFLLHRKSNQPSKNLSKADLFPLSLRCGILSPITSKSAPPATNSTHKISCPTSWAYIVRLNLMKWCKLLINKQTADVIVNPDILVFNQDMHGCR